MATVRSKLRRSFSEVRAGKPGQRFQAMHDRTKRSGRKGNALGRALRVSGAIVAFTIGVILVVIPGPAIPFFFVAAGLLATESRLVARMMDGLELRLRKIFRWGEKHWRRLAWPVRIAIGCVVVGCSIASTVLMYRFFRD